MKILKNTSIFVLSLFIFSIPAATLAHNHDELNSFSHVDSIAQFQNDMKLSPQLRINTNSGQFCSNNEDDHQFIWTYNGWDMNKQERLRVTNIESEFLNIINGADKLIVASFFLFDSMYSKGNPKAKITDQVVQALIRKKEKNPKMQIALILDPVNRAYSRRVPPLVKDLLQAGIDVYFSDLLSTTAATKLKVFEFIRTGRTLLSGISGGFLGSLFNDIGASVNLCVPFTDACIYKVDGHAADFEVISEAILLKANHRKIIVADSKDGKPWKAIVASANPHNGSDNSTNTALKVRGDLAKFVYANLREDMGQGLLMEASAPLHASANKYARKHIWMSPETRKNYKHMLRPWGYRNLKRYMTEKFPPVAIEKLDRSPKAPYCQTYLSEVSVKDEIIKQLEASAPTDEIRIIMFYLSDLDVVKAIINAAKNKSEGHKIKLLLDPSKDAFNSIKDGTPNRQVAHHIVSQNENIEIRWYATHGEQNHAKAMSITNKETGKYLTFTGSANWTGKNLNGANMESNLLLEGSPRASQEFNSKFDKFWFNKKSGVVYTWHYSAYNLDNTALMVSGYKKFVKKMSPEQIKHWKSENTEYLYSYIEYTLKLASEKNSDFYQSFYSPMNLAARVDWLNDSIDKNKHMIIMAMSHYYGKIEFDKKPIDEQGKWLAKWQKKYMKKWTRGEDFGLVTW